MIIKTEFDMKLELDEMMSLIKDYKSGYGGVTDSFMRKELELFAKDYHARQCNKANVVEPKGKFYCKKGTCTEEQQCNHCWNAEHPFNQVMQ